MTASPPPGEAEERCRFCGGPDLEDGFPTHSGTCGICFYGMRLDRERWAMEMAALGRPVRYVGGGTALTLEGGFVIACRAPFEPDRGAQ